MAKASVTIGGVPLAGNSAVAWHLTTGVQPYQAVFTVSTRSWDQGLMHQVGRPIELVVTDSRGVTTTFERLTILHKVPSDGPKRTSFLVSDRRWKWSYALVCRDFNVAKKTGDRTIIDQGPVSVPVELQASKDEYAYRAYSLQNGTTRWTAKAAVEEVLKALDVAYDIESFPIEGDGEDGQFTLQNVILRDQGDVALARLLSYIPGAEIKVAMDGTVVVFDGTDLHGTEQHYKSLPPPTWDGEKAELVNRVAIRPHDVVVHYQREVEVLFDFSDDYGPTSAQPGVGTPFLENVLPTTDPSTTIILRDPETGEDKVSQVPAGTWVPVLPWLAAMDTQRPTFSVPWTFEFIRALWLSGKMDSALGGGRNDNDEDGNVSMRIQAFKQHFRQTFRINSRYTSRSRDIRAMRVGILNPITGARAAAGVWGQVCIQPSAKSFMIPRKSDAPDVGVWRNVDFRPSAGENVNTASPGPAAVDIIDEDLGVFRVDWLESPYGTVQSIIPCHTVDTAGSSIVPTGDLSEQETKPVIAGTHAESGTNGIFLKNTMRLLVMLTIVPSAPNNESQFHRIKLFSTDVEQLFQNEFMLAGGTGPTLNVFVPPGECTARFAWQDDNTAPGTLQRLLGLDGGNGIELGQDLPGFLLCNENVELKAHSRAVTAELIASFADSIQGRITTRPPDGDLKLVGNMGGVGIHVSAFPSGKVVAIHEFPGFQKPISRMALLPDSARQIILGTLPFKP